ncbi:MAG: bifunctional nuclease family protein [Candidatus Aureabacteria bacterium]|jgi:bifunctional DNase/RNase|nr:bifunctional nuclease family protein [Candidatus Auribacterota bacterium]NLW94767.1 bifunctional nuclease family protein [Chlamydiota bacterium]HOE28250.1 bifunctional nuclease family protein [bacterium]HQM52945.1 bifunctional nuclease family protein [bacterium]
MPVEVRIRRILVTPSCCAVFLDAPDKTFLIHVGRGVGMAISMAIEHLRPPRPLSHDLIMNVLAGLGVRVERVVINNLRGDTFYARLYLREESERGTRLVEVDARPSDCLALAVQAGASIQVEESVLDRVENVRGALEAGEGADESADA